MISMKQMNTLIAFMDEIDRVGGQEGRLIVNRVREILDLQHVDCDVYRSTGELNAYV